MNAQHLFRGSGLAGAVAAAVLFAAPLAVNYLNIDDTLATGSAIAAEGGKGGPSAKGQGGQGGQGAGGASARGGGIKPTASTSSSSKLGRLNMARAFVSPGFDITKVDDPLAPIAQIALYKDLVTDPVLVDIDATGTALGNVATVSPVTPTTVLKVNELLGISPSLTTDQLAAIAAKATEVLLARRTEETTAH